ncbi:hypothetical protein Sango_2865100 [Sesamum angolense]|uniref:Reverse transcriptase domain-containing protein n=1 Tax=Sesamum angolense TaxID=2727404 RepID=A0AAE1VVT6_9LAMI|nr:hypothetical protein Sango_2865100 [Sesamum angolense]
MLALIPKRLRLVLDAMISPSQNAFVPGRSIGDNILLAQEMFTGYNRQGLPKRCALKVDLRKAYDTVEWDFLIAALQLFGFPDILLVVAAGGSDVPVLVRSGHGSPAVDDADVASIQAFRRGLDKFANLSGLHANPQKSQLIISRSAQEEGAPNCSSAVPGGSPPPQVPRSSSFSLTAIYLGLPSPPP